MTFKEMARAMKAQATQEVKTQETTAPAAIDPAPAPAEVKPAEEPAKVDAPTRNWSIPVYTYTPRAVVANRNTLSNAANEAQKARIICEKWDITEHVVIKVDKSRADHITMYYDDDAIRAGLFAISNHLQDVETSIEKVTDISVYRRGSSKPAPAPAENKQAEEPAPLEEPKQEPGKVEEPKQEPEKTEEPAPAPAPVKLAPVFPVSPHKMFDKCLIHVRAGVPLFLAGPAGSGKTTLAKQLAAAVGKTFNSMSFCGQTSKSDLLGYMDATGKYRASAFRHTFENGGVFLCDEIDAANPNILTVLNSAIANGLCSFPDNEDKMIEASPDFYVIAAANTFGRGAKGDYTGRNILDAATLDRFAFEVCEYDENMELKICGNAQWARRVQAIRAAVAVAGERLLISPRASINGAKLLAAGMSQNDVEECVIWRGVNRDVRDRITARIVNNYSNAAD